MTTPMKCPTCGENNDGKMQFCIFCGTTIVPPQQVKQDDVYQSSIATVPNFPAVSNSLICSICHRTDPLHGQYCVFCGGRTTSHAQVDSSSHIPAMVPMRADNRGGSQNLSGEYQFAHSNAAVRKNSSSGGGGIVAMIVAIVLGIVLGGGTGFGAVYAFKGSLEPSILEKQWTGDGLVVYTALPGTNVMVENHDEKSLYAGIAGKTGALAIDSIHPGSYRVSVLDGSRSVRKNVVVNDGSVAVVGYPEPLK